MRTSADTAQSPIPRMPGEGGCFAGNAVNPVPPPH
jgi:hypothetical protein